MKDHDRAPVESPGALGRTAVGGISLGGAGYVLSQGLTTAAYLALARLISPEEFGQYAAGMTLVGVGLLFAESGLAVALIQRRDRVEEAANTVFVATVLSGFGLTLLALGLAPVLGLVFDSRDVAAVSAALSGVLFIRATAVVPGALMMRRFSFLRRIVIDPAGAVVFGAVALSLAAAGVGVWALVLGTYAAAVTRELLSWVLARWRPRPALASFALWRELIRFGRHVVSARLVSQISTQLLETILLGRFTSTAALGQYRYGRTLASLPAAGVVDVVSHVLFPVFSRISHDEARFHDAFLRSLRWICVVAFPVSFVLLPLGEPLALVILGDEWRDAGRVAMIMCVYGAAGAVGSVCAQALQAAGRPDELLRLSVFRAAVAAILMGALIVFGLYGIAAALAATAVAAAAYAIYGVHRLLGVPLDGISRQVMPALVPAAGMAGCLYGIEYALDAPGHGIAGGLAILAIEGVIGLVVYLAGLTAVSPETVRDMLSAARGEWARRRGAPADQHTLEPPSVEQ